ncbi:MAG: DUF748 domain-containing protein [Sulfurimonas sp.]
MFKKIVFSALILYTILGIVVLPLVLKPQLIKLVQHETNAKLSIENISFNPFFFKLTLDQTQLSSLDNKPLIGFKSLLVDVDVYSLFVGAIHIKDIVLQRPEVSVVYNKDKTFNLLGIIKPTKDEVKLDSTDTNSTASLPRIIIDNIQIVSGRVAYEDFTRKDVFDFSFHEIGFKLQDIDTNDFNNSKATLKFYSNLGDGGFVDFKTNLVSYKPVILDGTLNFQATKLYTEWKYIKDQLNIEIADGKVSFGLHYFLNLEDLNATIIDNVNIALDKLRILPKGEEKDVLNLKSFYVTNATIKPLAQNVHIEKVGLDTLDVHVKRDKAGNIDWQEYIKISSDESNKIAQEDNSTKSAKPWSVVLDAIALENIALNLEDASVKPNVTSKINSLNFYAQNIKLDATKAFPYQLDMLMNDKFKCNSQGNIRQKSLEIQTHTICKDFDLAHYRPYIDQIASSELKVYDLKLKSAVVGFDSRVKIKDVNKTIGIFVNDTNVTLSKFYLTKRSNKEKLVTFNSLAVNGIEVDTLTNNIGVQKVLLDKLILNVARNSDGKINFDKLVVPKKSKVTKTKKKRRTDKTKDKALAFTLKQFSLKNAKINFNDKALLNKTKQKVDRINLNAYNIDIKKNSWLNYKLVARVNSKGYINAAGKLRHTPLKEKGSFALKDIRLKDITPYLQESSFVSIDDGKLSLKAKTYYAVSKKNPNLQVNGSVSLKDLYINDSRDKSPLITINDLKLKKFTFELFPNRLYIDEVELNSFYVDAMIDENKQMNFAKLQKSSDANETDINTTVAQAKLEDANASQEPVFPVKILKIKIRGGNAKFADFSIPLKFKTDIHDLNGEIYVVSNSPQETAYIDISGEVDKYGSTKLKGSINGANPKEYTDLDFNFKNLELNSLSGYSASFAGHEIESGKLYLDLGYKIQNSQLLGKNSVMIKSIKLGKETEDENVTVLPLGFVIALLEDSDGIIDIDMPVEGNLDEPDFKYGALVWKTFGNLMLSAVTSPFRFLGSMMGIDGDALEFAEFEFANNTILPPQREKLDNIAKMMIKRPKIKLHLAPTYDIIRDKRALQLQKLVTLILKKSNIKTREDSANAMSKDILESIYKEKKNDDKLAKLEEELHAKYKDENFNREYKKALIKLCSNLQIVSKEELEALAHSRVSAIKSYLTNEKEVAKQRMIQDEIKVVENKDKKILKLDLTIKVE